MNFIRPFTIFFIILSIKKNDFDSRNWALFHFRTSHGSHYHKRSNIEATNAAIKHKFGETLKSKNPTAPVIELLAKIVAYNLTVVIHEMYENGIKPEFAFFIKL